MHKFLPLFLISALSLSLFALFFGGTINSEIQGVRYSSSPAKNELSSSSFVDRILLSDGQVDQQASSGVWFNKTVSVPNSDLAALLASPPKNQYVLGENTAEKWIE